MTHGDTIRIVEAIRELRCELHMIREAIENEARQIRERGIGQSPEPAPRYEVSLPAPWRVSSGGTD